MYQNLDCKKKCAFYACLALLIAFTAFYASRLLPEHAAVEGYAIRDYVYEKAYPQNFQRNYTKTILASLYDQSLVMRPAYLAYHWLDISPEAYSQFHLFAQICMLVFGMVYFIAAFTDKYKAMWLSVLLALCSAYSGMNLSFFGATPYLLRMPLYYLPAMGLSLAALGLFFRGRHFLMFVAIGLAAWCHMAMAIYVSVFIGAYFLLDIKKCLNLKFIAGVLICLGMTLPLAIGSLYSSGTQGASIPLQEWLKGAKMFGYHWFLSARPLAAVDQVIQVVLLLGIYFATIVSLPLTASLRKKLLAGGVGICVFTVIGLMFTEIFPVPDIIRLSPQRSTYLLTLMTMLLFPVWLFGQIRRPCFPGGAICAAGVLIYLFGGDMNSPGGVYASAALVAACLIWERLGRVTEKMHQMSNALASKFPLLASPRLGRAWLAGLTALVIGASSLFAGQRLYAIHQWDESSIAWATDFKNAQLWARENSPPNALFMTDPAHHYAWSGFSIRSHFGSMSDWGYICLVYIPDATMWEEGKRRLRDFGLDMDGITLDEITDKHPVGGPYYKKYLFKMGELYYALPPERFKHFQSVYGVDYAVLEKSKMTAEHTQELRRVFPVVYENNSYLILDLNAAKTS